MTLILLSPTRGTGPLYQVLGYRPGSTIVPFINPTPPEISCRDGASGNITVDDRDTSIIHVGSWHQDDQWEYNLTTSRSPSDVAGGTATFRFNGASITIHGTTGLSIGANTTASIMFAVDGGTSTTFHSPQNSNWIQHNTLFHVAGLSNTQEHTITMTSLDLKGWNLDYVYTTQNSSIAGGGSGSSIIGPMTGLGGNAGVPNIGAVAGGVVAGLVALLAIAGIIFILLRRHKRKLNEELNDKSVAVGVGSHFDQSFEPLPSTPPATGSHTHANPLPSKRCDFNSSGPTLTTGVEDTVGRPLLDSSASTSYLGMQSPLSSLPLSMSQYSDGDSQQALTRAATGPGYG